MSGVGGRKGGREGGREEGRKEGREGEKYMYRYMSLTHSLLPLPSPSLSPPSLFPPPLSPLLPFHSPAGEKPESVPLSELRVKEEHCWRKLLDLERTLCWSSAKTDQTLLLGSIMVGMDGEGREGRKGGREGGRERGSKREGGRDTRGKEGLRKERGRGGKHREGRDEEE